MRWETLRDPSVLQAPVLGRCRDLPAVPMISSMQGASVPTCGKREGGLSILLLPCKCRKHFPEYYLQLPGRRWGQSSAQGATDSCKTCFCLSATTLIWKQIKTESSKMRGEQKGRVTSGFWENLIQDKCWIIRVTDEGDTGKLLLVLRYYGQRDTKFFCLFALISKPAPS